MVAMTPSGNETPPRAPRVAFTLGAALLLGCLAMYLFTFWSNARRGSLETVAEPRAVGDQRYFPLTAKLEKNQQLATFGKRVLLACDNALDDERDTRMEKVGLDETVSFYIYRSTNPAKRDFFYLKAADGKYIKCAAR